MSVFNSPLIVSSQTAPHKNMPKLVRKYLRSEFQDSIPKYAYDAFEIANEFIADAPIVLDSVCGTGESSWRLAKRYPEMKVLGVDKSSARLQRCHQYGAQPENLMLLQSNCVHLWRLIKQSSWNIQRHYLFYPNPWPKPGHLQRRWHAHPIFPTLFGLGGVLTLRTNWHIYALEFVQALELMSEQLSQKRHFNVNTLQLEKAMTPFERKYLKSQHPLYEVIAKL